MSGEETKTTFPQLLGELSFPPSQLAALFRDAPEGVILTDFDGLIYYANPKARKLLHAEAGELPSRQLQDWVEPSERAHITPLLASLLGGVLGPTELRLSSRGRSAVVEMVGQVVELEEDLRALLFLREVTARRMDSGVHPTTRHSLIASEAQLRSILDHASELIFVLDRDGVVERANPAAHRALGIPAGRLFGTLFEDLVVREFRGLFLDGLYRALEGEQVRLELPMSTPGWALWVDLTSGIFGAGDDLRIFWIGRNVTERREKEQELWRAKAALEEINETLERRVLMRTQALASLHDLARDLAQTAEEKDLIQTLLVALQKIIPAELGVVCLRTMGGLQEGFFSTAKAPPELERICKGQAQKALLGAQAASPQLQEAPGPLGAEAYAPLTLEGEIVGILWVGTLSQGGFDGEVIKLLELIAHDGAAALYRIRTTHDAQREMLQAMVDSLAEGAVLLNEENQILAANTLGRQSLDLLCTCGGLTDCALHEFIQRSRHASGGPQSAELHREERIYVARATSVNQPATGEAVLSLTIRDVSEERAMARAVVEQEKMASVGMLAAGVAHEINNPAAYVLANLSYLQEVFGRLEESRQQHRNALASLPGGEATWEALRQSEEQVGLDLIAKEIPQILTESVEGMHRIRDIVRDLRSFARPQGEHLGEIDLKKVLDSVLQMASFELKTRCKVNRRYDTLPPVYGHAGRLAQVFLNLVVNAAHAMQEEKQDQNVLTVESEVVGERALIRIQDTGHGIPPEHLSRIFEPFFTTKEIGQGTGLGLTISRDIVRRHKGEIFVESTVGRGSTFVVALPLARESAKVRKPSVQPEDGSARRGRLLLIDDETHLLGSLARALSSEHDVDLAPGGKVALDRLTTGSEYDLVLCDLMMPDISGMAIYKAMAKKRPDLLSRFVFITGKSFAPEAREFLQKVENPRLDKPVEIEELRRVIDEKLLSLRGGEGRSIS